MKQSLIILVVWVSCILSCSHAGGEALMKRNNRKEIRPSQEFQHDEVSRDLMESTTLGADINLASDPDVSNEHARRSHVAHATRSLEDEGEPLQLRTYHLGLAANPDVITESVPTPQSSRRLRRSIGKLTPPSAEGTSLEKVPTVSGQEEPLSLSGGSKNLQSDSEPDCYTLRNNTEEKISSYSESDSHSPPPLYQASAQIPLNLNTVGLGKSITLPLYRRPKSAEEECWHPEIQFEKHLHHALRRHAKFLDKSIDEKVLEKRLLERVESLGMKSLVTRQLSQGDSPSQGFPVAAFNAAKSGLITPANPVTAANSMGLHIEANDVGYFAEVLVGTPPTIFRVIVDTGSSDTWLQLEDCRNIKNPSQPCNHPALSSKSSTLKRTKNPFSITYGTGKVKGVLIEEKINLGGLILNNHIFGGVTLASNEFTGRNVPFDGIMGTAISVLSNQKVLTPIEAMVQAGTLPGAFIGYALGRVSDPENIGQVTLGGIDQTKFSGDLTIFPNVNRKGFWEGAMKVVQIGGKTVLTDRTGILDTGTTLIIVPPQDAKIVHSRIPGAVSDRNGGFRIPCTNTVKIGLSFGGVIFDINPVDLTFQPVSRNLKGLCISGISAGTVGGPRQWLIGDVFLKNVYFATDVTNNQMGLAVLNPVETKN